MKSANVVPSRLEKMVANAGTNVEYLIKLCAIYLMFIYCMNYSL